MKQLDGRVAVVTGAASGLGHALASALGDAGCALVLADIERRRLDAAADELTAAGHDCLAIVTDVSDAAVERHGAVHILCNNAGVSSRTSMIESTLDDYAWVLGVGLWGCIHGIDAFLPILLEQDEGHVVNVSSMAGLLAFPLGGPYNAAKAAVVALSETLDQELRLVGADVGVSVVCPGGMRTDFLRSARNRSERYGPKPAGSRFSELQASDETARRLIDGEGMDPREVADLTVDAIRDDRLFVLSHREMFEGAMRERLDGILGTDPPMGGNG